MRQAGRYLPEYRELRKGRSMLEAVSTPDIAAEITLQPLRRFGFDAAILFSDLTVLFDPMGAKFDISEGIGPVVEQPVRTQADLDRLRDVDPREGLPFVLETIRILKRELKVPLIGFTGAPFTLASYLIEGGPSKDHRLTRSLMYSSPEFWHPLMDMLARNVAGFLRAQVEAGADAVQLFDSWIGLVNVQTYREAVLPHMKTLFQGLAGIGVPTIHFGTGTAELLPVMQEAGGDVIGVDWRTPLDLAAKRLKPSPLQGNLDPAVLLSGPESIRKHARDVVERGRSVPGHIFNLGHGIYPDTPLESVECLVETVRAA
jgi:uroporphyrinogen decarboxylase